MSAPVFDPDDLSEAVSAGFLKGVAWVLARKNSRFSVADVRQAAEAFGGEFVEGVMAEIEK